MKDILNSIKVHLHEKSTSPLFGAFALSWIGWNYKLIFVLFSDMKVIEKFKYIETDLYPLIQNKLLLGFAFPFLTATIFIFLYPYPAEIIFSYWKSKQKKMNELRQKIEGDTLLSINESQDIRRKIDEIEYKHNEELAGKDAKYSDIVKEYTNKLDRAEKRHKENISNLTDEDIVNSNRKKTNKFLTSSSTSSLEAQQTS